MANISIITSSYHLTMPNQKSKIPWSRLSESDRKELLRVRNARTAKLARQRRHEEEDRIHNLYMDNESRMDRLEDTVDKLMRRAENLYRIQRVESRGAVKTKVTSNLRRAGSRSYPREANPNNSSGGTVSNPSAVPVLVKSRDQLLRRESIDKSVQQSGRPTWFGDPF